MKVGELYTIKHNDQYLDDSFNAGEITIYERSVMEEPITGLFLGYESDELDEERIDALKKLREHAEDLRKRVRAPMFAKAIEGNIISKIDESLDKDPDPKARLRFLCAGSVVRSFDPSNVSLTLATRNNK